MRDVYVQNSALGDPNSLDKQLEENAQKLDKLNQELQKFEVQKLLSQVALLRIQLKDLFIAYTYFGLLVLCDEIWLHMFVWCKLLDIYLGLIYVAKHSKNTFLA